MRIRLLLSTALILIIGLIYFRLARPEAMVIESLVTTLDSTETIDTRSRELLLEKLNQGDRFTQYYVARSKRTLSKLGLDAYSSLLDSGTPELDAMLSVDFQRGTSLVGIDWNKALSLYLSGLDSCSIYLGNAFELDLRLSFLTGQSWADLGPSFITGVELIELELLLRLTPRVSFAPTPEPIVCRSASPKPLPRAWATLWSTSHSSDTTYLA